MRGERMRQAVARKDLVTGRDPHAPPEQDRLVMESELLVASWRTASGAVAELYYNRYNDGSEDWAVHGRHSPTERRGYKQLDEKQAQSLFDQLPGPHILLVRRATIRG